MKWLRRNLTPARIDPAATDQALAGAEQRLQEARSRRGLVERIASDLLAARQENNFAARLRAAYGEGR